MDTEPLDDVEAGKRTAGEPYVTRAGYLVTRVGAPPTPPAQYTPLAEGAGDIVGRRVIAQTRDGHQRGLYVCDSPKLGAELPDVPAGSAQKVFVPLMPEAAWWHVKLNTGYDGSEKIVWVPIYRIWLDEAEGK